MNQLLEENIKNLEFPRKFMHLAKNRTGIKRAF